MLRLPLWFGIALLGACTATTPTRKAADAANPGTLDESALNALYANLDADSRRIEVGLALARAGEAERAREELAAALDSLQAQAARCATVATCDSSRFIAAYDHLLRADVLAETDNAPASGTRDEAMPAPIEEAGEADSPLVASLPAMERTITLLKGRELADILTTNDAVKAGLEEWLTHYRPNLVTAYVNYQYMRYRMWPEYHRAGLPEALLFGMLAKESGGRVHAVSRSGASGPLQFMFATGRRFGLETRGGFDQRFDPALSARANAAYINEQLEIFNGNLELVIAAYNGGEGRVRRLAERSHAKSFWDPSIYGVLPDETRDYVPMVLAAAWLFLHPERYNLQFPKIDGRPGQITLAVPTSLNALSICLGNEAEARDGWFRTLRNLNPAHDPKRTLPAGMQLDVPAQLVPIYQANCVEGEWLALAQDLGRAAEGVRPARRALASGGASTYTVRKGDNLAAIARRFPCTSVRDIARMNDIKAPHYRIRAGQHLRIPQCG